MFHAGAVENVIPQTAELTGTARTLKPEVRAMLQQRLPAVVEGVAAAYGATAQLKWVDGYPVTANHPVQAAFAPRSPPMWPCRQGGRQRVADHGSGGLLIHAGGAAGAFILSAMATAPGCTTRSMISPMRPFRSAPAIGCVW